MIIRPALCLDLDGTIRHNKDGKPFIQNLDDIVLYPDAEDKILQYKEQNYFIFGITNQGGVAFGYRNPEDVQAEFAKTISLFKNGDPFDEIMASLCHEDGTVEPYNHKSLLRKPNIGMLVLCELYAYEHNYAIDWNNSLFVGDRPEDEQCAANAGIEFQWANNFFKRD